MKDGGRILAKTYVFLTELNLPSIFHGVSVFQAFTNFLFFFLRSLLLDYIFNFSINSLTLSFLRPISVSVGVYSTPFQYN